jgi:hypothetical protein
MIKGEKMNGIGDKFNDFLKEEGLYEEVKERADRKLMIFEIEEYLDDNNMSKEELAKEIGISKIDLDNILDIKQNVSVESLQTTKNFLRKIDE